MPIQNMHFLENITKEEKIYQKCKIKNKYSPFSREKNTPYVKGILFIHQEGA